jgi:tol-pal system protein YbgF
MKTPLLLLALLSFSSAQAIELSIQQRLAHLEKIIKQQEGNSNAADIVMQNQVLQQQIAELKGVIEEQNYQIKSLKEKQKLLYIDVDSRLATLESQSGSAGNSRPANHQANSSNNNQPLTVEVDEDYGQPSVSTNEINDNPKLSTFQEDYDIAFAHLRAGRFLESARAFEDFIQNYPQSNLTDNAYYWLGESYYVKRQYPQALAAFQSLTTKFPKSSKAADSLLKIGYSYYEMDDLTKAETNLQIVIDKYPNTSISRLAKNRLLQIQRDN